MYITKDRRIKPRIECDYPAVVEGTNGNGSKYQELAQLINLSSCGLFMLVNRNIAIGTKITVTIHLCNSPVDSDAPKLATTGFVIRTEPITPGSYGVAIKFHNYRFI